MRSRIARVPSGVRATSRTGSFSCLRSAADRTRPNGEAAGSARSCRNIPSAMARTEVTAPSCLEGVEDVLYVPVRAGAQALQGEGAGVVQVEPGLDPLPDRLRQPGDRDRLLHAVDRGKEVRHDHVVCLLHRGGRLVRPGWAADGVADGEGGLESALPQGLGVREQRAGLRDREQAGALPPDDPGLQRPADDKAQAGQLGGAAELQALVTGAEQGDEFPGVRGPDVLRRGECPALRAEPLGQRAELGDYLAVFGSGGELLRGRGGAPGAGSSSARRSGRAAWPAVPWRPGLPRDRRLAGSRALLAGRPRWPPACRGRRPVPWSSPARTGLGRLSRR